MREFWKFWNNGKGGDGVCWSQAAALEWRTKQGVSLDQAFAELVEVRAKERDRGRAAIGIGQNPDPERSDGVWIDYQWMQDRPVSLPPGTACLGVIPADDWKAFRLVVDAEGRPTSSLEYASSRIPAWARVEFDYQSTIDAWLALIRTEPPVENEPTTEKARRASAKQYKIAAALPALVAESDWAGLNVPQRRYRIAQHFGQKEAWCSDRLYYRAMKDYQKAQETSDGSAISATSANWH